MEAKYRFRTGEVTNTGKPVPQEYWNERDKNLIGGSGFGTKKIDGKWMIVRQGEKIEHDNPADYYNTVLKMAKKRAHVDAMLTATAASDIFTQDLEDLKANGVIGEAVENGHARKEPESNGNVTAQEIKELQMRLGKSNLDQQQFLDEFGVKVLSTKLNRSVSLPT